MLEYLSYLELGYLYPLCHQWETTPVYSRTPLTPEQKIRDEVICSLAIITDIAWDDQIGELTRTRSIYTLTMTGNVYLTTFDRDLRARTLMYRSGVLFLWRGKERTVMITEEYGIYLGREGSVEEFIQLDIPFGIKDIYASDLDIELGEVIIETQDHRLYRLSDQQWLRFRSVIREGNDWSIFVLEDDTQAVIARRSQG